MYVHLSGLDLKLYKNNNNKVNIYFMLCDLEYTHNPTLHDGVHLPQH